MSATKQSPVPTTAFPKGDSVILLRANGGRGTAEVTCDTCERSCSRSLGNYGTSAAPPTVSHMRGDCRNEVFSECPHPKVMHLATPAPKAVELLFVHRGELRLLWCTMKWEVCSIAGGVSFELEIYVRPVDDSDDASIQAGDFAMRLRDKGYRQAQPVKHNFRL